MLALSPAAGATPRRAHAPVRPAIRQAHPPSAATPRLAGPALDADGHPSFAEPPAPLAAGDFLGEPSALEGQVEASLAARCPARLIDHIYEKRADFPLLVAFGSAFDNGDGTGIDSPDAVTRQVLLEAYRRCVDRAITAIQTSPQYVVRNPDDRDCVNCAVRFSDLALSVPRLHIIKGLTYLAPRRMADQDPVRALAAMREGIADFARIQADFQEQAEMAFDAKRRAVRAEQRAAQDRAMAQTKGAAIGSLLGAGLGMAMGVGAQQSFQMASNSMQQRFGEINNELAVREQAVSAKQQVVDAHRQAMFGAPTVGEWSDDGIRVTLPRVAAMAYVGGKADWAGALGAVTDNFHMDKIVHLTLQKDDTHSATCTGSIVGPRLVLTNRHCVTSRDGVGEILSPGAFQIEWRYVMSDGKGMQIAANQHHVVEVHTSDMAEPLLDGNPNDWAFLVTKENVGGTDWLELVDPAVLAKTGELRVALAGYSADLNDGSEITMDWGCRARWYKDSLFHTCHMWHGASGSPIIAVDGAFGRRAIVGVNSAFYGEMESGSATGLRVGAASPEMFEVYQSLREQQRGEEHP